MASFRRAHSVSAVDDYNGLEHRVQAVKSILEQFKESGEIIEEADLQQIIQLLVSQDRESPFLQELEATEPENEQEALTMSWLARTYSCKPRKDSVISLRSSNSDDLAESLALLKSPTPVQGIGGAEEDEQAYEPNEFPVALFENEERVRDMLAVGLDRWDFDVFEFSKLVLDRPLLFVTWAVLRRHGCFERHSLDMRKMRALLTAIENGYVERNPYHNHIHAADVVQTVHFFLIHGVGDLVSPLEKLALIIAAAGHDVGHNGVNNAFHVNTSSTLAIRYNDNAVLEQYHAATLFGMITGSEALQPFNSLTHDEYVAFRKTVIKLILATDMSQHATGVSNLKLRMEVKGSDPTKWENCEILLEALLHAADISNPVKPTSIAATWANRCLNEFWNQGDLEKSLGLAVSPMCDRCNTSRPQSQIGFINFVVKPYYVLLSQLLPALKICVDTADANLEFWNKEKQNEEQK